MDFELLLPSSQGPVAYLYSESDESLPFFLKSILIILSYPRLGHPWAPQQAQVSHSR